MSTFKLKFFMPSVKETHFYLHLLKIPLIFVSKPIHYKTLNKTLKTGYIMRKSFLNRCDWKW